MVHVASICELDIEGSNPSEAPKIFFIMEYKIGDKVRIVKRTILPHKYPFWFSDEMASLESRIFTITEIRSTRDDRCRINGDYHSYLLTGEALSWIWHSSMFEPVESSELKVGDTVRVISKGFDNGDKPLIPEMRRFIGSVFTITNIIERDTDHCTYHLSDSAAGYFWPASALEKVLDDEEIEIDPEAEAFLEKCCMNDVEMEGSIKIDLSDCEISTSVYNSNQIKIIL